MFSKMFINKLNLPPKFKQLFTLMVENPDVTVYFYYSQEPERIKNDAKSYAQKYAEKLEKNNPEYQVNDIDILNAWLEYKETTPIPFEQTISKFKGIAGDNYICLGETGDSSLVRLTEFAFVQIGGEYRLICRVLKYADAYYEHLADTVGRNNFDQLKKEIIFHIKEEITPEISASIDQRIQSMKWEKAIFFPIDLIEPKNKELPIPQPTTSIK